MSSPFPLVSYKTASRRNRVRTIFSSTPRAYAAVSTDLYLHPPHHAPHTFADFRGTLRIDLPRGATLITRSPSALSLTITRTAFPTRPVVLICRTPDDAAALARAIADAVAPLSALRARLRAFRVQPAAPDDAAALRDLLVAFALPAPQSTPNAPPGSQSTDPAVLISRLQTLAAASKGTAQALQSASDWAEAVAGAINTARPAVEVLQRTFSALPIIAPLALVLGLAADLAALSVTRSARLDELSELGPRCSLVAADVVRGLLFSLDYAAVEEAVIDKLFVVLGKCCQLARLAEQYVMKSATVQMLGVDEVAGLADEVKEIESQVTALRILQYVQENHSWNQRADQLVANAKETFRRALLVAPAPVPVMMDFGEESGTVEGKIMGKLFDDGTTTGLVGLVGGSGLGKTTVLTAIANEPSGRRYFDGGIYQMDIGRGCSEEKLKAELSKAVQSSGGRRKSEEIFSSDTLSGAISVAKEWFFGRRCLFIWDDVESSAASPNGFLRELRVVVDLIVGARGLFSTRDWTLVNAAANPRDIFAVEPRSSDQSEHILCRHADIGISYIADLRKNKPGHQVLRALDRLLSGCDGVPVVLAVAGKALALRYETEHSTLPPYQVLRDAANDLKRFRVEALETKRLESYDGYEATMLRSWKTLAKEGFSVGCLDAVQLRRMHASLCVLEGGLWSPCDVLTKVWDVELDRAKDVLIALRNLSFLSTRLEGNQVLVRVHSLMHSYCMKRAAEDSGMSVRQWHAKLLQAYFPVPSTGRRNWTEAKGLQDGYLRQNLVRHISHAGMHEELRELLLDISWIRWRLSTERKALVPETLLLENDYRVLGSYSQIRTDYEDVPLQDEDGFKELCRALGLISASLKLSRLWIRSHPSRADFQIHGRLLHVRRLADVDTFLHSVERNESGKGLHCIKPSMAMAGDAEVQRVDVGWPVFHSATVPGRNAVAVCGEGGAAIVDIDSGTIERVLFEADGHNEALISIAVTNQGSHVVCTGRDGSITAWDLRCHTKRITFRKESSAKVEVVVTPDGKHAVTAGKDRIVCVWNLETGEPVGKPMHGHTKEIRGLAVSPDGRWIATASADTTIRVWDIDGKDNPTVIDLQQWMTCVTWTPNGQYIIGGSEQCHICVCAASGDQAWEWMSGHSSSVTDLQVCEDGRFLFSGGLNGDVLMWDLTSRALVGEPFRGHLHSVSCVTLGLHGGRILSSSYDGTVREWRLETSSSQRFGHDGCVSAITASLDNRLVASGSYDGKAKIWDMETGAELCTIANNFQYRRISCVVFSPDSKLLACAGYKSVRLWNIDGTPLYGELEGHDRYILCATFTPDGNTLITGSEDKTLRVWDVETGKGTHDPMVGHKNWVKHVVVRSDGQLLASFSMDKTVRFWNTSTWVQVGEPIKAYVRAKGLRFSTDGTRIIIPSYDSRDFVFDIHSRRKVESTDADFPGELERKLHLRLECGEIRDLETKEVLGCFDGLVESFPLFDEERRRIWVPLLDGNVGAVEVR